jgi:hypothetical protein
VCVCVRVCVCLCIYVYMYIFCSLPGSDKGLVLRFSETGCQLRLKAKTFGDYASWLTVLRGVPGIKDTEFPSLSLLQGHHAAAAAAADERDASRRSLLPLY